MRDPYSEQIITDQEAELLLLRAAQQSLGRRRRRRRFWPLFLVLLVLVASGIVAFRLHVGTPSGLPSSADADGVANFSVGTHPSLVINAADGAINVHANSVDHVVTLRAVSIADNSNNTAIPYTQSNGTYTFDVSEFSSDTLDLAVPALTDLQLTTTNGAINVNGVSGQMMLSATNAPITITGSTLEGSSSLSATNGGLILNSVTFSSDANLISANGDTRLTNVHFQGAVTLDSTNGGITANGTTFVGKVTVTNATTVTTTQATFQGGAIMKASQAMDIAATFGEQGNYEFITSDGDIDLTPGSNESFHLDATASNGSVSSEFPTIRVTTDPNTNATLAQGNVGTASKLTFTLTSDNGSVRIHKG